MAEVDHTHVGPAEGLQAADSTNPQAPDVLYVDPDYEQPTSWRPTRKWLAATTVAAGTLATLYAQHGWHWDEHTSIPTIGLVVQRLVTYWLPNEQAA